MEGALQQERDSHVMSQGRERRHHPRLPLHLSIAKLIDYHSEGLIQPAPAVLVDLSAGGLSMICFVLPKVAEQVTFKLELPGLLNAEVHGKVVRVLQKGETYQVAIAFTEAQDRWAEVVETLSHSYQQCEDRLSKGERRFCFGDCGFFSLCQKDEKGRMFPSRADA
jgi:hypothetical protein